MGQRIVFNEKGLNLLELNTKVSELREFGFNKMENNKNIKSGYTGWFPNDFQYFYIKDGSMFIENGGLVKDVFFASDSSGKVRGIFLVIEHIADSLVFDLDKVFGKAHLQSCSSIENIATNSKRFWKKDNVSVFLKQYPANTYSEISIDNTGLDENTPGIMIDFMYN